MEIEELEELKESLEKLIKEIYKLKEDEWTLEEWTNEIEKVILTIIVLISNKEN